MVLVTIVRIVMVGASPLVIVTNLLILSAWFRFKRLRTPSNALVVSLAAADFGFGLCLPMAIVYQLFVPSNPHPLHPHPNYPQVDDDNVVLLQSTPTSTSTSTSSSYLSPSPDPDNDNSTAFEIPADLHLNIRPFSILVVFSVASLLSVGAIALDRFTSVAQPLRYNHFVTTTHVQRFIGACWLYAFAMGVLTHLISDYDASHSHHQNSNFPSPSVLLLTWLTFLVYLPCLIVTFFSYGYIYLVARSHARAIYSVEVSLHHHDHDYERERERDDHEHVTEDASLSRGGGRIMKVENVSTSSFHHRYGLTLALILSMFLLSWTPLLGAALSDYFARCHVLDGETSRAVVCLPIICNSLVNPWLYGFRSSEMRIAVFRMWDSVMTRLMGGGARFSNFNDMKQGELTSCASNVRLLAVSPTQTTVQCCSTHPGDRNHLQILLCDQTQL